MFNSDWIKFGLSLWILSELNKYRLWHERHFARQRQRRQQQQQCCVDGIEVWTKKGIRLYIHAFIHLHILWKFYVSARWSVWNRFSYVRIFLSLLFPQLTFCIFSLCAGWTMASSVVFHAICTLESNICHTHSHVPHTQTYRESYTQSHWKSGKTVENSHTRYRECVCAKRRTSQPTKRLNKLATIELANE